jgi:glycosyltransferase involved in cell wall biosynthesis
MPGISIRRAARHATPQVWALTVPRRQLRLVYLITSKGGFWGGAESQVHSLARSFRQRGWDVGVVSMLPNESSLVDLESEGIRVATLGLRSGVPDPRGAVRLLRLLQRWKPDVLHAHMVHANLLARLTRPVSRTPVLISTIHNENEGSQWRYRAYGWTHRLSDVTSAVSGRAVDESIRRGAAPAGGVVLVPNGISIDAYRPDLSVRLATREGLGLTDEFAWLAVGRVTEAKAYPDMVEAFKQVIAHRPAARLFIAGIGPLEGLLRERIQAAELTDEITPLGLRSDIPALMQAADAFVMSSAWEGLPMVLLEAGASALPIVATDVGGSRDAVIDGTSGYLVPAGQPRDLARAMRTVIELPEDQRQAMGDAGRAHIVRTFDLTAVVDRWEALYLDELRGARRELWRSASG